MSESPLAQLVALQALDQRLASLKDAMTTSSEHQAVAREADALKKRQAAVAALAEKLQETQRAARRSELDLSSTEEEIPAAIEGRLYGGSVQQVKELAALESRLQHLRRQAERLEEQALEALEAAEQLEERLATTRSSLESCERAHRSAVQALDEALDSRRGEIARLQQERDQLVAGIPADWLERYHRLYPSTQGRPVALVEDGTCTACHMKLPTSARAKDGGPVRCESCGRLLLWVE